MDNLEKLLLSGDVWIEGTDYVGRASDGVIVSLGRTDERLSVEAYLETNPLPKNW